MKYALAAAIALLALPAQAERAHPTVQCAAFWGGWVTVAARSPFLPQDPADAALARAFAAAAAAEAPQESARHLARDTVDMARMIRAAIAGHATSRGLMERLARGCEDAARARGLI
jgi:hypothetical protein